MIRNLKHFIAAMPLLILPHLAHAQAPTLGSASNFVLFTTTGAVGNTGISNLTGDIGTNNGSITGFGNVNGNMHNGNGTTSQCAADLLIAYNQLNSTIPTVFLSTLIGNGDTLTPAVYETPAMTTLSGDLTLDALGNPNAVFILRIQGPLSTATNSSIKLINGALACNVYWKVEGVASMASNTFFRGNLIVNNAAINMSPNDTLEGRAFSTTGAVNVNGITAYIPTGCGSPALSSPAAPTLASVACFAIFSGNSSVINAGITSAAGDIGTNVGLAVVYNPLLVNGIVHPLPNGATALAASDLTIAYNYLNNLPNDIELLYPAQFGNNLILTPHTYHMAGATSFTGTVFLDARNNPNAVFVIKVNGAFSTGTFSKVELMNQAQAENVYWCIDGDVSIADYSVFNGTIIANNGAIDLMTGDTINGRALTTNGALRTASVYVESPVVCFPLPVSWLYFDGTAHDKQVVLQWATISEQNNNFFTLEKSSDGKQFETLTTQASNNQTNNIEQKYSFVDIAPFPVNYYRISQTDNTGIKSIYKTIKVMSNTYQDINISHAILENTIRINTSGMLPGKGQLELFSMDGKRIFSQQISFEKENDHYQIPTPTQSGIYMIRVSNDYQVIYTNKVLIH